MDTTTIETRIHAAIRPQLDRCDELLDYYTEGLPREVWQPLADELNPRIGSIYIDILPDMSKFEALKKERRSC